MAGRFEAEKGTYQNPVWVGVEGFWSLFRLLDDSFTV